MAETVKYKIIAETLRSQILSGAFQVGDTIPPELQLQEDYGVSRHTIRQAIAELVNEGYLRKEKGSGTYVSNQYQQKVTKKKTIGVITTYLSDYIFPSIIRGIEKVLSDNDYSLLLTSTNNNTDQERRCLETMLSHGVDGLIVEPTKSNQYNPNLAYYLALKERGIPYVMINAAYEELDAPFVCIDDVRAGFLATDFLLQEGHAEIGLITKLDDLQGKNRMKGFIKAFKEKNLAFNPETIFRYTTETKWQMLDKVRAYLASPHTLDALVCYNDEIAVEIIKIAAELGIKIPAELSLVGQDDSFLSTAAEVKLTSVTHPKEALGEAAAEWIIQAVASPKERLDNILFEPELIVRSSTQSNK